MTSYIMVKEIVWRSNTVATNNMAVEWLIQIMTKSNFKFLKKSWTERFILGKFLSNGLFLYNSYIYIKIAVSLVVSFWITVELFYYYCLLPFLEYTHYYTLLSPIWRTVKSQLNGILIFHNLLKPPLLQPSLINNTIYITLK